jgi:hypothetical protein
LGKRCPKTAKVDPKRQLPEKFGKDKSFPEKGNCRKKLAKL